MTKKFHHHPQININLTFAPVIGQNPKANWTITDTVSVLNLKLFTGAV
ncbi:MAG: hypothetical protein H0W84_00945 [Bacteroidetes bacterium]|nr:hypothetical protein [Bacteroidota bacterium]